VATAGAVAEARREAGDEYRVGLFGRLFPGQIPQPAIPTELTGDTIALEGHELRVIDTGHTDTMATSVLWCPTLRLLVAGDVVYNRTHMYLGESTAASRREWIATLTKLKDLDPLHVVAGHKQPDGTDDPSDIDESIQYLTDFNDAEARTTTPGCPTEASPTRQPRIGLGRSQDHQRSVAGRPITRPRTGCGSRKELPMSITSDAAAEEGTPTQVTRFDGVRVPAADYHKEFTGLLELKASAPPYQRRTGCNCQH
jgi:metallo-beta-lactamase superfamily protein